MQEFYSPKGRLSAVIKYRRVNSNFKFMFIFFTAMTVYKTGTPLLKLVCFSNLKPILRLDDWLICKQQNNELICINRQNMKQVNEIYEFNRINIISVLDFALASPEMFYILLGGTGLNESQHNCGIDLIG